MGEIKHTLDVDPAFDRAFLTACAKIGCKPIDLLGVMFSESQCRPAAHNPHGGASGLIQFMPSTLVGLGWKGTPQDFRCLSASQQLPYVVAYFTPWQKDGAPFDSAGRVYQCVFLPGTLKASKGSDAVIAAKGGRLGWAYDANAILDVNGDKRITIGDLTASVMRAAKGPRWLEMLGRLGIEVPIHELADLDGDGDIDITSASDVQAALRELGADLIVDGIAGPKTIAAVRRFQEDRELHADGIAGPLTRAELAIAVAEKRADSRP